MHSLLILLVWVGVGIFTVYTELQWDKYICDFFTRQTNVVIACFWRDMGFVASTRFCRESGFVANTRFFGLVLSRLLLRHKGFYSDFVQISVQNIGGWDLWFCEEILINTNGFEHIMAKYIFSAL